MTAPAWWKRDIIRPTTEFEHDAVTHVQRVLRCNETGEMDEATISKIKGLQTVFGLRPTGIIDEATAEQVERIVNQYAV